MREQEGAPPSTETASQNTDEHLERGGTVRNKTVLQMLPHDLLAQWCNYPLFPQVPDAQERAQPADTEPTASPLQFTMTVDVEVT